MLRPIITLTTDFGLSDHFAGVMKGVILGIARAANIVDITHEIRPFEISEGAFTIYQAYRWFPRRTIHVVVVDPGVGTARRPILVEAAGQFFIGPDNGVLSMIYGKETKHKVREITAAKYFLKPVSRTFHGRDIFAPAAAHLAAGVRPAAFGKLIDDYLKLSFDAPLRTSKRAWTGSILKIDRFGNLITNLHIDVFPDVHSRPFELHVGARKLARLALNYADSEDPEPFVIIGSSGYLEVACNQASAARVLGCGTGAPVELTVW
ncbi:MAG TPA: SAM-dependent chlorinase/fluorinase [Bryobacteraceae bacterium]|nr:SAM-dependent chlorinase/fluorinase [Bryobacteraceae bacterium]